MTTTGPTGQVGTAAVLDDRRPATATERIGQLLRKDGVGALVVLTVISIFAVITVPGFGTTGNVQNTLLSASFPAMIAVGMTFVIISGGIDLSVGSVFALGSVLSTYAVSHGRGFLPALALTVLVCTVIGLVQGTLIARSGLPPFIMTLAGLLGVRGLVLSITDEGQKVYVAGPGSGFVKLGTGSLLQVGYPVWIAVLLFVIGYVVLERTGLGLSVFAIGGSEDAALLMGLKVRRVKIRLYVLSALCAGAAGLLQAAYSQSGIPTGGDGYELQAIAAVVIGGTLLTGGSGSLIGTGCGVLLLAVVQNVINLGAFGHIDSSAQGVVTGLFLVVVVALQRYVNRTHRR